jgi:ribosomal protein S18 acetylase RimI-like enzyme
MRLARATADDAAPIAEVWLRSRKASIPANPPSVHSDAEVRAFFADVAVPMMEAWVAEDGGVVGLLVLDDDFVNQLHVDPDHQRRGVGTALVELAKRQRPAGLQLWTFQSNEVARRLYERHGFVAVEETDDDNVERAPDVRYAWRPSG